MQIVDITMEEMLIICVRMVREGINFRTFPAGEGLWTVVFTGGF
jgi:hypothetical protein